jgi:hypothetical protein
MSRGCAVPKNPSSAVGPEHAHQLRGEGLCRFPIHIVDQIPAEDAVDRRIGLREPLREERRKRLDFPLAYMAIEIRVDVLYENLAAKLLAEVRDVAADDRSQIQQDRRTARG